MKRSTRSALSPFVKIAALHLFTNYALPAADAYLRSEQGRRFGRNLLGFAKDVIIGPVPNPNGRR